MSFERAISAKSLDYVKEYPNQKVGIGGMTFGARITENITFAMQAPDVPLEDGSESQDHLILKPVAITIDGYIGDMDLKPEEEIEAYIKANKQVGVVRSYLPERTQSQIDKVNSAVLSVNDVYRRADAAIKAGKQLIEIFKPSSNKTLQEQFFEGIREIFNSKSLIDIQTSFGIYKNMVLTSVSIPRELNVDSSIRFSLSAKQIRFAETIYSDVSQFIPNQSVDLDRAGDGDRDQGSTEGDPVVVNSSTWYKAVNFVGGN